MRNSIFVSFALIFSNLTQAEPPHTPDLINPGAYWSVTFYNDASPAHALGGTQTLCFFPAGVAGTHQRYEWVSDSWPDWNGRATQEGDQVFMFGDYPNHPQGQRNGGHSALQWELVTQNPANMGAGHWQDWYEDATFGVINGFGNAVFQRIGQCPYNTALDMLEEHFHGEIPVDENGEPLPDPTVSKSLPID